MKFKPNPLCQSFLSFTLLKYFKSDKYNDPKIVIDAAMKNDVLKTSENKCYKAKKDGIYLG